MNGHTSITVTVRSVGGTYQARTTTGKASYRQTASSTNSPYFAARAAAGKFLRPNARQEIVMSPTLEEDQFASSYTATLVRKVRTAAERDWRRAVARAFPEGSPVAPKTGGAS